MKTTAGVCLLVLQIVAVVHARWVPSRWLAWAPNDYAVGYQLQASVAGRALTAGEIWQRYHLVPDGVYENPAQNLMDIVRQRERTYGRNEHAKVTLVYRPNGEEPRKWQWPEK